MQEAKAKQEKETNTVKSLNDKLNAAKTAADAGDYDTAIAALTEATQMDPSRDLVWFKLADYYRLSAVKQTDSGGKAEAFGLGRRGVSKGDRPQEGRTHGQRSLPQPRPSPRTTTIWRKPMPSRTRPMMR